ncbi:prepilin peptidase [Sphingomicrobium clamense]|uniref:Prepilin peptidase n=1 Tax=Sphingomicrobium clamense TaxID=2851013 RepID=A0ABS6V4Q5_9SPHN|nr:prepilin peptidase [Sphingomicrobium sp. B8]MBW0144068.1 prepilin peptidase [Sphingomicrobium sp. B8]
MNLIALAPEWLFYLFVAILVAAAAQDIWKMKISNYLVLALLIGAIAAAIVVGPEMDLWKNVAILVVGLALGTGLFAAGIMGGGDVKLTVAAAVWFLWTDALIMLLLITFAGVVVIIFSVTARFVGLGQKKRGRLISYGIAVAMGAIAMAAFERGLIAA